MARQRRIQKKGFHYISNRSIELRSAFITQEDYQTFIDALCQLAKRYLFKIHAYTLLPHAYHLVIETSKENLSSFMKLLNSEYAHYFNLKYGRNGALWEGRFRSSFMEEQNYVFYFINYMENLPKVTGITSQLRSYSYSTYRQFVGLDTRIKALEDSIMFQRFNSIEEIRNFFKEIRNKEFIDNVIEILRKKSLLGEIKKKVTTKIPLEDFFGNNQSRKEESESTIKAYTEGYFQKEIADFLGIKQQTVSSRIKKYMMKSNLK